MNALAKAIRVAERAPMPDALTRAGIAWLVGRTDRNLSRAAEAEEAFARAMVRYAIAEHTDAANEQHYELPPEFFALVLGPRRKYSCCLFDAGAADLAAAEVRALEETVSHADIADGQRVLELGCGWGSLTLFMAERFPASRIVAVSNAQAQRAHIEREARRRGLTNIDVVTADMNDFAPVGRFDRVVSVEMFEHMSNWRALLARIRSWLAPQGRLFLHVFTHDRRPYRFDTANDADWIARHFFTGGIMPSHGLIRHFPEIVAVEAEWRWSGRHYRRTAEAWLANFDANRDAIDAILREVYRDEAGLWARRWRWFFLATAGLFGYADGESWGVSHYRLAPAHV